MLYWRSVTNIIGRTVLRMAEVTSTNDIVRLHAERGEPEGFVVTADRQRMGRGRMGRRWVSPVAASVQMSVLLRPPFPASKASGITQMAALAVAAAVREILPPHSSISPLLVSLKWPNDVLLNSKKCAGILVESVVQGEVIAFAVLGIGVNANFSMREFPDLVAVATTLADEVGKAVDREGLQAVLLDHLDKYYSLLCSGDSGESAIFREWRSQLSTLGQAVRVANSGGIEEGVAMDVEKDGTLLLMSAHGLLKLDSGDVTVLKNSG